MMCDAPFPRGFQGLVNITEWIVDLWPLTHFLDTVLQMTSQPPWSLPTHIRLLQFICACSVYVPSVPRSLNHTDHCGTKGPELGARSKRRVQAFEDRKQRKLHWHVRPTLLNQPRTDNNGNQAKAAFYVASQSGTCAPDSLREEGEYKSTFPFLPWPYKIRLGCLVCSEILELTETKIKEHKSNASQCLGRVITHLSHRWSLHIWKLHFFLTDALETLKWNKMEWLTDKTRTKSR